MFFASTKLFQNKDINLRRMVYLCIKDICPSADEVIIVTSSLMKDMNSKTDLYRSNSVRVLCKIIDSGLLMQIERYLKQAIVDKSTVVASAALVSALHLLSNNTEIVKRWVNEIQEAAQNKNNMVQVGKAWDFGLRIGEGNRKGGGRNKGRQQGGCCVLLVAVVMSPSGLGAALLCASGGGVHAAGYARGCMHETKLLW